MAAMAAVSEAEKEYTRGGFTSGVRSDGRGPLDFRHIQVQTDVVKQANGSARVVLGGTEVVVGVKVRRRRGSWEGGGAPMQERAEAGMQRHAIQ